MVNSNNQVVVFFIFVANHKCNCFRKSESFKVMSLTKTVIILLNWNNAKDTIECVDSLLIAVKNTESYIVIFDNNSVDKSVKNIQQHLIKQRIEYSLYDKQNGSFVPNVKAKNSKILLLQNDENFGFAKGNNEAIKVVKKLFPDRFDRFFLLNNDTIVQEKTLVSLFSCADKNKDIKVWTPVIVYADNPQIIWNAGGYLGKWGGKKYIGHKKLRTSFPAKGYRLITFITGCALLVDKELTNDGNLLNEDFFFGEEDYYFSLKMKKKNVKMGVCFESELMHKVSTSIKKVSSANHLPLFYINYLNRIINMKNWMSDGVYKIWKPGFIMHAAFNTWWKRWYSFGEMTRFVHLLSKNSKNKQQVTREDFFGAKKLF